MTVTLHTGDCLDVMAAMEPDSVDSIVTDPPYGLAFMGKDWDHGVPGIPFWEAALRVAKPGAHLLAFGGTRTFHRLAVAIEDAGWELRDTVMWVYGSGFPKSHDVSKAIDKAAGAEREVVGEKEYPGAGRVNTNNLPRFNGSHYANGDVYQEAPKRYATAPATPDAERWAGWGTALKPAWEPVIVARKPFPGTVAANVLAHGTGAINVDGCRVEGAYETRDRNTNGGASMFGTGSGGGAFLPTSGRWPANLVHDGSDEVLAGFPVTNGSKPGSFQREMTSRGYEGGGLGQRRAEDHGAVNLEKPGYPDTGSAARFFYCAKASRADRDDGLEGMEERLTGAMQGNITGGRIAGDGRENPEVKPIVRANVHPCVKPTPLMRWLCRLVTPPGGIVLDPFMGSGSTGKAAVLEGFSFVGVDREAEYVEIARRRIDAARLPLFAEVTA